MVVFTSAGPKMWFGTREYAQWIETPLSGADVSSVGWSAGGVLLNGGGWQKNSDATHKTYNFSWRKSSTRQQAQLMQSFRDGTYGTGPLYFLDPLTYTTNILPKTWADPSLAARNPGLNLIPGITPTASRDTALSNEPYDFRIQSYPINWATYTIPSGSARSGRKLFVPIPEGYSLHLGAVYQATGTAAIKVRRVKWDGTYGTTFTLESIPAWMNAVTNTDLIGNGDAGVEIWVEKLGNSSASIAIKGMTARVQPQFLAPDAIKLGPWVGGQGHSGVRFEGDVKIIEHNGMGGGQVEYAATFKEVGTWE